MSRVSVIIPTYNRPDFLRGAVESVTQQRYDDVEVVVVDDGSDGDYASEVVSEYDSDVKCIVHDVNRGLSAARNTGIEAADGEYIAFLDDDDRWQSSKLEKQVAALEANPNAGLATCLLVAVAPDGSVLRCGDSRPDGDLSDEILRENVIGSPSRVVVRSACLERVGGFDEELPTKQDWDLYIRLCQEWRVVCVDDLLCFRTRHASMSSDPADAAKDNRRVIEKHEETIRERGLWDETMGAYHAKVAVTYLLNGNRSKARKYLKKAIERDASPERVTLYVLSYLPYAAFDTALDLKRAYERLTNDCPDNIEHQVSVHN